VLTAEDFPIYSGGNLLANTSAATSGTTCIQGAYFALYPWRNGASAASVILCPSAQAVA
jgi:hypothetical protein